MVAKLPGGVSWALEWPDRSVRQRKDDLRAAERAARRAALSEMGSPVAVTLPGGIRCLGSLDQIQVEDMARLMTGTFRAIRIPNFLPRDHARTLKHFLLKHPLRSPYLQNVADPSVEGGVRYIPYNVDRIGFPRNLALGKPLDHPIWREYFRQRDVVESGVSELFARIGKRKHPMHEMLDGLRWPGGVHRKVVDPSRKDGHAFVGIGRVTLAADQPGRAYPLEDKPHVDGPYGCTHHLSANIYLGVPQIGGRLELLDGPVLSGDQVAEVDDAHQFRDDPRYRGSIHLAPRIGELIIVNTRLPHAVERFFKSGRVSMQTFLEGNLYPADGFSDEPRRELIVDGLHYRAGRIEAYN